MVPSHQSAFVSAITVPDLPSRRTHTNSGGRRDTIRAFVIANSFLDGGSGALQVAGFDGVRSRQALSRPWATRHSDLDGHVGLAIAAGVPIPGRLRRRGGRAEALKPNHKRRLYVERTIFRVLLSSTACESASI